MIEHPLVFRVRKTFDTRRIDDVEDETEKQLKRLSLGRKIEAGQTVAVAVGSRGIAGIPRIVKSIVDHLVRLGAAPFIVPAMGSHGGGTAGGQAEILETLGIDEASCGCPIRSSMETVVVGEAAEGFPIHFDKHAFEADHVVVCNRVKTHTQFVGDIESGVLKMMLIGLGKQAGARVYHRAIRDYSFGQILRRVTSEVLARCSVTAADAIVENSYSKTALIEAIEPEHIEEREKELLVLAKRWAARLPFETADVLLIDEIGKNISGTGFDLSIVGRKFLVHRAADAELPKVRMIALRDLTDASRGNAEGMGLAEFCRTRLLEKVDRHATRLNGMTSGHFVGSMEPLDFNTDRELLDAALTQIGLTESADAKLLWIRNTLTLAEVECSAAYLEEAHGRDDLEVLTDLRPLPLDASGNLCDEHMSPEVHDA